MHGECFDGVLDEPCDFVSPNVGVLFADSQVVFDPLELGSEHQFNLIDLFH